jgi:hypothetical protein
MQYVCDAPGRKTWFRIETQSEAFLEDEAMRNSVEHRYEDAKLAAVQKYQPAPRLRWFERDIGLNSYLLRSMPMFLTLRDSDGTPLLNAMLPPCGKEDGHHSCQIVGPGGADASNSEHDAVRALEKHFGLSIRTASAKTYYGWPL